MEIDLGLDLDLTEYEKREILSIYAETVPHLDIVEDIEMFLAGYKTELGSKTLELIQRDKELIPNIVSLIRMEEDNYAY